MKVNQNATRFELEKGERLVFHDDTDAGDYKIFFKGKEIDNVAGILLVDK